MIQGPDRLVIDFPGATPGTALRRLAVNRGAVKGIRASLYSTTPSITRVVVDLISPQWYRIVPDASGFLVTVGGSSANSPDVASTVGWVSTRSSASTASTTPVSTAPRPAALPHPTFVNGASVDFTNGLLTIHARDATLSEVLFQIQKKTGAEIAIPAGTEQERVAADFGPGTPSEVLGELLNGSDLNFVVVGSQSDPKVLRSVLLSRKGPEEDRRPVAAAPQSYTPPVAENTEPDQIDPAAASFSSQQPTPPPQPDNPPQQDPPPSM